MPLIVCVNGALKSSVSIDVPLAERFGLFSSVNGFRKQEPAFIASSLQLPLPWSAKLPTAMTLYAFAGDPTSRAPPQFDAFPAAATYLS